MSSRKNQLDIIGATEHIDLGDYKNIPAKIDTGADSSSIWASHIRVNKDGVLLFRLFDKQSPFYTGRVFKRTDFKAAIVRDASGREHIRYRTHFKINLNGRQINALFYLADRSNNNFPVLIGRRTIVGKFFVDVSKKHIKIPPKNPKSKIIQRHFQEDPYQFHLKYMKNNNRFKQKGVL